MIIIELIFAVAMFYFCAGCAWAVVAVATTGEGAIGCVFPTLALCAVSLLGTFSDHLIIVVAGVAGMGYGVRIAFRRAERQGERP
jgi:hypothetical protein